MKKVPTGDNLRPLEGKSPLSQKSFSQRMEMLLVSTPFVVLMALGAQGCSNEPNKVIEKNVNPGTTTSLNKPVAGKVGDKAVEEVEQKKEGGDIVSLHSLMLGDEKMKVVRKKEDIHKMYQTYIDSRSKSLGPNAEKYMRGVLLSAYIGMLKEGYEIDCTGLDDLMERIPLLSDGELTIKTGKGIPQISEFTGKIMIVGEKITEKRGDKTESKLLISERGWGLKHWGANTNEVSIVVDPKEFFKLFYSDLSPSVKQSEKQIAEINNKFILEQEKLRLADNTVEIRDFQIAELGKDMAALEKEKKRISDKAIADAEEAKKEALRIKGLTDTALKDEQTRLQGLFTAKEKELSGKMTTQNTEIGRLTTLMETQSGTFETNRQALKKTTDEINKEVVTLSNRITAMEREAIKNRTTIESQSTEVTRLSGENKALREKELALVKKHEKEMADFQLKLILK